MSELPHKQEQFDVVDNDNPWLGLESFTEEMKDFFHGRGQETIELFHLIKRGVLTVLFGQSGLGKSSLLKAGLFPLLRSSYFLPVFIRLDYTNSSPTLLEQIRQTLKAAFSDKNEPIEAPLPSPDESLWEYFHRADANFWNRRNRLVTPILVFDQFEEFFSLGGSSEESRHRGREFLKQLSELVENRPPETVLETLNANPDAASRFDFDKQNVKIVLSLREDFLANLEDLKDQLHPLMQNRMRLKQMNGQQALEAVVGSGGHLLDEGVGKQIVEFVAGRTTGITPGEEFEDLTVEPALLSLVCRELNYSRILKKLDKISTGLLSGTRTQILEQFYERCLQGMPHGIQVFIEDELLTSSGFRKMAALEDAFEIEGVTREAIETLVKGRLLRYEERFRVPQVELIHDVLTGIVKQKRDSRYHEEALAREKQALEEEKQRSREMKSQLYRTRRLAFGCFLLAIVALFAFGWGYTENRKAVAKGIELEDSNKKLKKTFNDLNASFLDNKKLLKDVQAREKKLEQQKMQLVNINKKLTQREGELLAALKNEAAAKETAASALDRSSELIYKIVSDL